MAVARKAPWAMYVVSLLAQCATTATSLKVQEGHNHEIQHNATRSQTMTYRLTGDNEIYWNVGEIQLYLAGVQVPISGASCSASSWSASYNKPCTMAFDGSTATGNHWSPDWNAESPPYWIQWEADCADTISIYQDSHEHSSATLQQSADGGLTWSSPNSLNLDRAQDVWVQFGIDNCPQTYTPSPSPSPTASPGTCSCTNPPCGCNCWDCTEERRASGCCTCAENKCGYYDKSGSACAGCSGCWYNGKCGCSANMYGANMYTEFGLSCPDYLSFYATATPSTTTSTTTSSSTPTDHHVPDGPSTGAAGGVAATGDPHLANVRGQRFDLMKPGTHVLVNIPRGRNKHVLLRVQAEARQLGGQCADMYFQELNITGEWVKAKGGGDLLFHAQGVHDEHPKWLKFEKVELKVAHGHTLDGAQYLNFYVRHLGHAGFAVGGLLGEDDHSEAAMPSEACAHRASLLQIKGDQSAPMLSVAEASFV